MREQTREACSIPMVTSIELEGQYRTRSLRKRSWLSERPVRARSVTPWVMLSRSSIVGLRQCFSSSPSRSCFACLFFVKAHHCRLQGHSFASCLQPNCQEAPQGRRNAKLHENCLPHRDYAGSNGGGVASPGSFLRRRLCIP